MGHSVMLNRRHFIASLLGTAVALKAFPVSAGIRDHEAIVAARDLEFAAMDDALQRFHQMVVDEFGRAMTENGLGIRLFPETRVIGQKLSSGSVVAHQFVINTDSIDREMPEAELCERFAIPIGRSLAKRCADFGVDEFSLPNMNLPGASTGLIGAARRILQYDIEFDTEYLRFDVVGAVSERGRKYAQRRQSILRKRQIRRRLDSGLYRVRPIPA